MTTGDHERHLGEQEDTASEPVQPGFTASDLNELDRLRGVARAWSVRKAEEEFGGANLSEENYEYLRIDLESEYLRTSGDERKAEEIAWERVFNAISWDRYPEIADRFCTWHNARARERGDAPMWEERESQQS